MLPSRGVVQSLSSARTASSRTMRTQFLRTFSTVLRPHNATRLPSRLSATPAIPILATGAVVAGSRAFSWRFWQRNKPVEAEATAAITPSPAVEAAVVPTIPEATVSAVTPQAETVAAAATDASSAVPSSINPPALDLESILAMPETVGYLKQLGLDFGWGASQSMMWLLENVHVYSGLPWWGSIFLAQFVVRVLLFKPLMISHETSTRMQILRKTSPEYEAAMQDFRDGLNRASVDPRAKEDAMLARQTYLSIEKAHGVNKLNMFWGVLQLPVGIGFYRVLSAMADIPVPSLETGGFSWFHDLTVPDPFYLLPLAGPGMMILALSANSKFMPPEQRRTTKLMSVVLMPLSAIFTSFLPAAVQWYFFSAGFFGALQNIVIARPAGRKFLGLPAIPDSVMNPQVPPTTPTSGYLSYEAPREAKKNIFSEAKDGFDTLFEKGKDTVDRREKKAKLAEKLGREEQVQEESWAALRARMAQKEKEARMRGRRHL